MADTNFRGPVNSMGSLEIQGGTSASIEPMDGPSSFYQAYAMPDPRDGPFLKDGTAPGRVPAFYASPAFVTVDAVPQASATNVIAAAQVITASTPMNLVTTAAIPGGTAACQIALGVPLIPRGTSVVTTVMALDFGFVNGTVTANSSTVNVTDNTLFTAGQWICIGNCGNATGSSSIVTQVQAIHSTNGTGITIAASPLPATTLFCPIGGANLFGSVLLPPGTPLGPANASANAVSKSIQAGLMRVHNPREMLSRTVLIKSISSTANSGANVLVSGFDVWGNPMTELIVATSTLSGTASVYGNKAFKYILSAVPNTTIATSYLVGIGDTFGFPLRVDEAPTVEVSAGGTWVVNTVGITVATTAAATQTTGDVRGTITLSALATGTPISAPATSNGTSRLYIVQTPSVDRMIACTPLNTVPLFGVAQSTA